jgi:threonine dehydratase
MPAPALSDILEARRRLAGRLRPTPLLRAEWLSRLSGAEVWLKPEGLQRTQAFKIRGALNALLDTTAGPPGGTIVTASAGNHGRGVAEAARETGRTAVVFTPRHAPQAKLDAIREAGARLEAIARDYDEAEALARSFERTHGAQYVSPYNDPLVIAGAGTIGLEILDELPDVDAIVVPIGGGGLLSGIGIAVKAVAPEARIVGVEASCNPVFHGARAAGRIVPLAVQESLADGLVGNVEPGSITIDLVERLADDLRLAREEDIGAAIAAIASGSHLIAEGAGAVGVAALMAGSITGLAGRRVVVVISGANIDRGRLAEVLGAADDPGSAGTVRPV